ncbi:hypothetical protein HF086_001381 [Spodoptera exigua]|uniref:Uncharacterized protein n=1 Tax=Spodoptera exigua TaxID=7107 RepID=A0A922MCZ6_SPOEX|nr:hypothetical protein HF086_001381 [Spodoptera exigua]
MRLVVFLVTLCYSMPRILAQINVYNFHLRDIHYTGEIGHKPLKYKPLSTKDQIASEKAADVVDFIQLVPKIDPLKRAILPPVGIDIPLFFLKGKVYMKRVIMSGLKQLELRHLEMRMINLRTDVNINFPLISIAGKDFSVSLTNFFL